MVPTSAFILYLLGVFPNEFNPTPIAIALVGPFFFHALVSDRLLSDLSIAKQQYFDVSLNPALIFSRNNRLIGINKSAEELFNKEQSILLNKTWQELTRDYPTLMAALPDLSTSNGARFSINNMHFECEAVPFRTESGESRGLLCAFYDVTHMQNNMIRLEQEAQRDGLTGLFNRKYWNLLCDERIHEALHHKRSGSLLLIDLDHFKHINDHHGHLAGDAVLKHVAKLLKDNVRETDVLGRYGGEELGLWLGGTCQTQAVERAETLRRAIEESAIAVEDTLIKVTASIGIYGEAEVTTTELECFITRADAALYYAKNQGRNRVCAYVDRTLSTSGRAGAG